MENLNNYDQWKTNEREYQCRDEFGPFEMKQCFDCNEKNLPMMSLRGFDFCVQCAGNAAIANLYDLRKNKANFAEVEALHVLADLAEMLQCDKFKYVGGE